MSVVVGVLETPNIIRTEEGERISISGIHGRAAWSWLRLQAGRRIDDEIKQAIEAEAQRRKMEVKDLPRDVRYDVVLGMLEQMLENTQRPVQYIIDGDYVKAVASTQHLLIPPEEVQAVANQILAERGGLKFKTDPILEGLVATDEKEVAGLYLGFHLHPGDILTRRAISVSSWIYTILCTNPLTWAGIGNFGRFGIGSEHERVLRIQKKSELRPRLEKAIDEAAKNIDTLKQMVEYAKKNKVDPKEARVILTAFSKSYGIGDKVIQELLERLNVEDKTTWGMSQAASYVARHGENFRKTPEGQKSRARQSMATVGAASLLIEDPSLTYEKAMKWLKGKLPEWPEWLTP